MEGLRDIKDIVEVHEYSLYIFMALIVIVLVLLLAIGYWFKTKRRKRKKLTPKQKAWQRLKGIDFHNTKETVYGFEEHILPFLEDKNADEYEDIVKALDIYKYKKEVPQMDEQTKIRIQTFIKGVKR